MTASDDRDHRNRAILQQACWKAIAHMDAKESAKAEDVLLAACNIVLGDMEANLKQLRRTIAGMVEKEQRRAKALQNKKKLKEKGPKHEVGRKEWRDAVQAGREDAATGGRVAGDDPPSGR